MKYGRMQCKDIPDDVVIQAVANVTAKTTHCSWRRLDDVQTQFELLMPGVPAPLLLAKIDKMRAVHACIHSPYTKAQCRGDVHLATECGEGWC